MFFTFSANIDGRKQEFFVDNIEKDIEKFEMVKSVINGVGIQ